MQGSRSDGAGLRELTFAKEVVTTFAEGAKFYWRLWGPLGEPMVRVIDAWTDMQRRYFEWVREVYGVGDRP